MINKTVQTIDLAVAGVKDDDTIMVSGFGEAGAPSLLMEAIINQGARNLTVISNNAGEAYHGLAKLISVGGSTRLFVLFQQLQRKPL